MTIDHSCQPGRHPNSARGFDLYETPSIAVHALLRAETLPYRIWEPAAGRSAIVDVLREAGHVVIASDMVDHGFPLRFVADFLTTAKAPAGCTTIVTNPPYRHAERFVAHALSMVPNVIMLLRLAFLESERRSEILEKCGLARVHVFRSRLPMMHRDGWAGPRASSSIPFAWFVWERGYAGRATISRI